MESFCVSFLEKRPPIQRGAALVAVRRRRNSQYSLAPEGVNFGDSRKRGNHKWGFPFLGGRGDAICRFFVKKLRKKLYPEIIILNQNIVGATIGRPTTCHPERRALARHVKDLFCEAKFTL